MLNTETGMTISVCVDCYFTHCDGETEGPTDREPLSLVTDEEVTAGTLDHFCETDEDGRPSEECECGDLGFSWGACQGCGSTLGGDRYALTVWS